MRIELTTEQQHVQASYRAFVDQHIGPFANAWDQAQRVPDALIRLLATHGYLGALLPRADGTRGLDMISYGLLCEELGRGCSSVRSLLTVHDMVGHAVQRWGSRVQKERWLPQLRVGETIAAFALSEPNVGSDARHLETTAQHDGDALVLNGVKKWTTFGQIASVYLVFVQIEGQPTAVLVERDTPGLEVRPLHGITGTRASLLAELHLHDCRVPRENVVGRIGLGFTHVAASCLDQGRYSVACGSVGIGQASLEASLRYTSRRKQFGSLLKDHPLIQQMVTNMIAKVKAARLLCYQAGYLKDRGDPEALNATLIAKYFASTTATAVANDAMQIHGANGCTEQADVQRYVRDARIMEIIEGSTQIQQMMIAQYSYQDYGLGLDQ